MGKSYSGKERKNERNIRSDSGKIGGSCRIGIEFPDGEESYSDGVIQGRFDELMWCKNLINQYMKSVNRREGSKGNGYGKTIS